MGYVHGRAASADFAQAMRRGAHTALDWIIDAAAFALVAAGLVVVKTTNFILELFSSARDHFAASDHG